MALSWISGYNNINYLNQMIKSVEDTLSNDYNNLDNIPIIKIISSTSNPQNVWELKEGMYLIDGIVYVDNNTSYEVSNLFVSMTARLENGKYVLSAFIPFFKGLYEYILKSNSTEYEEHQIVILATHERMLTRYNETPYEPNGDYNPATKKYVDDKANEIITELDNIGVNKETITSLKEENRIRDIKLQALLSETSDRNISISEDTRYFDMPLSIDNGIVTINEMIGDTLVNVCDQEESVAITKSYTIENENHIALQGEYDGSCRPVVYGNTLVNHNADWDGNLQTGIEISTSGTEDVVVEGTKGQEVSVVVEGNTVLNHALGKTSAAVSSVEDNLVDSYFTVYNDNFPQLSEIATLDATNNDTYAHTGRIKLLQHNTNLVYGETYTLIVDVLSLSENTRLHWYILFTDNTYQYSGTVNAASAIGKFIKNITISEENKEKTFKRFALYIQDSAKGIATIQNPILLKGDHTTNPKYVNSNNGNYVDLTVANDMSSVVEIEGRTMVNVCDQKDPIAVTKSYTVENSGNHIALQGEYDGKCRPVIQGNTMVNLAPKYTINWTHSGTWQSLFLMGTQANATVKILQDLKPATTYTIMVNITKNTQSDSIFLNNFHENTSVFLTHMYIYPEDLGIKTFVATTRDSFDTLDPASIVVLRSQSKGITSGETVIEDIMIFEGDLTQTPELIPTEYVEGLKSSFEDEMIPVNALDTSNILLVSTDNLEATFENNILEYKSSDSYTSIMHPSNIMTFPGLIGGKIYTMVFNSNANCDIALFYNWNGDNDLSHQEIGTSTLVSKGFNALKFDLWEGYKSCGLRILTNPDNCRDFIFSNFNILEGDWTHLTEEDFNHLGKYKVQYKVTGKNKFNKDVDISSNYCSIINDNGLLTITCTSNWNPAVIIPISLKKGNYYYTGQATDATQFRANNNIVYNLNNKSNTVISLENDIDCIYLNWTKQEEDIIFDLNSIQIEEGSTATEYEPYKEYTKTFYLNSPLLEGDTIEDVNGVATHVKRYEKEILNGSEGDSSQTSGGKWYRSSVEDNVGQFVYQKVPKKVGFNTSICDKFLNTGNSDPYTLGKRKAFTYTDHPNLDRMYFNFGTSDTSMQEWWSWLSENPVTIVYQLASPIYEPISDDSILCDSYVNGHLDVDSTVPIEKVVFGDWGRDVKYLQLNTTYILQFESDNNGILDVVYTTGKVVLENIVVTKGTNRLSFTTNSTASSNWFTMKGIGFNASNIVVTEATDVDFDYFEGLSSTYESCYPGGKNLFDGTFIENEFVDNTGGFIKDNGMLRTDYIKIKPNITYTISNSNKNTKYTYYRFFDSNKVFISYGQINTYTAYCTTPKNAKYLMVCYLKADILSDTTIQIEEGSTATSYEPFIDKYKVDVKVTGKNILDLSKPREAVKGEVLNIDSMSYSAGELSFKTPFYDVNSHIFGWKVQVKPNTDYSISYKNKGTANEQRPRIAIYDGVGNEIYARNTLVSETAIFCSGETHFLYVSIRSNGWEQPVTLYDIQLKEASEPTEYEPYIEHVKDVYLNSPLLEGDKIVTKNGKVYHYHKMGKVVLDGSENEEWVKGSTDNNGTTTISFYTKSITNVLRQGVTYSDVLLTTNTIEDFTNNLENEYLLASFSSNGAILLRVKQTRLSTQDVNGFRQWLQTNPTTVVYELASPYYELIDEYNNTILNIPKNVAHLTHTSAVPVNNTTFTNYKDELNVLEANTQYRVMFDCDTANIPFTVTLGGTSQTVTSKKGTHSLLITTPSTLVDKNLVIDGIGRCGIDNIRIFKGKVEYDYVKGLWSGYEERKLKNLCPAVIEGYEAAVNDTQIRIVPRFNKALSNVCNEASHCIIIKTEHISREFTVISNGDLMIESLSYINNQPKWKRVLTYHSYGCAKIQLTSLESLISFGTRQGYTVDNITDLKILVLEGDWTDNPPTYEEVMANEGKYAVKVKLDTNANIFGKGGRL